MTAKVIWWRWIDDGAVHAIPTEQMGRGLAVLKTVCELHISVWRLHRSELGPKCVTCRMAVEG